VVAISVVVGKIWRHSSFLYMYDIYFRIKMWTVYITELDPFHTLLHILLSVNAVQFIIHYYQHQQNSHFSAMTFLRRFWQIAFGFHFFGFRNSNSFTEQGRQPCIQPPTWRARYPYLCPLVSAWPSYIPSYWVPFSSPSTTQKFIVSSKQAVSVLDTTNK
jgi:hypothetical protein